MSESAQFDELELDLLSEMFNLGVGKAASSLSQIVKQEVKLSIPTVDFVSLEELSNFLGVEQDICSVSQRMEGSFAANSMLLFPESSSLEVVRQMLGGELSDEMIAELQQEAFSEIGNIVLNACIGAIAEMLSSDFKVALPRFQIAQALDLLRNEMVDVSDHIMLIKIEMALADSEVSGYMVFLLESKSMDALKDSLKKVLQSIG